MSWFDQKLAISGLRSFFHNDGATALDFGHRVYQTFEATTFAQVIKWYSDRGWKTSVINPRGSKKGFRLKYSTRGDAKNYTYVLCVNKKCFPEAIQIRHQIRVETFYNIRKTLPRANIVCDVAILQDGDYDFIVGNMHVLKDHLISFAEAKHMDAYAELVASFIGLVHEMQPWRLSHDRFKRRTAYSQHPKPFLNISGVCMPTAQGIKATIIRRNIDIAIHDAISPFGDDGHQNINWSWDKRYLKSLNFGSRSRPHSFRFSRTPIWRSRQKH